MRFLEGSGKLLQSYLQGFPWFEVFFPSKILVVGISKEDNTVAACGIRSMLNILILYVDGQHRGRGVGKKILRRTVDAARKRGLPFVLLGVHSDNPTAYHLYSTFGFRKFLYINNPDMTLMVLPLSIKGEVVCSFLNTACSWLPKLFLEGFAQWVETRIISGSAD